MSGTNIVTIHDTLIGRRLASWQQRKTTRLSRWEEAPSAIERFGIVTLFPASPEVPNLFHAYMGDPDAKVDSGHESPSGHVYGWRWTLGGREAAFYGTIVRNRPTWVSWSLTPAILRLRAELRAPEELYQAGELSGNARRIAEALEASGGALSTGDLRREAGFPTGKEQRRAYLKAMDELDRRLLVAKVFAAGSTDMSHALVRSRYPELCAAADRLPRADAWSALLDVYLSHAVYIVPSTLARHLNLPEPELRDALARYAGNGRITEATLAGTKGACYMCTDDQDSR